MVDKNYYSIRYYLAAIMFCFFIVFVCVQGKNPILDDLQSNKTILQLHIDDLKKAENQLAATGTLLHSELIEAIDKAEKELEGYEMQLKVPQAIFNDPFGTLAIQSPHNEFLVFIRKPELRALYNNLWSGILTPLGAQSLPDVFNEFTRLLDLVKDDLHKVKVKFTPVVLDLNRESDIHGIYKGLDGAIKDFEAALVEINKVEALLKALNL